MTPPAQPTGDVTVTDATPDVPDAATWRRCGVDRGALGGHQTISVKLVLSPDPMPMQSTRSPT